MRLKLAHKVVIAIAIPVIFQIGFLSLLLNAVESLDNLEKAERVTSQTLVYRNQICTAEALVFLYYALFRASQNPEYKKRMFEIQDLQRNAFNGLHRLWKNDKVKLQILRQQWMTGMQQRVAFRLTIDMPRAERLRDFFGGETSGREYIFLNGNRGNLGRVFEELDRNQSRLLRESQEKEAAIKRNIWLILFASILVSVGAGLLFSRSIAVRLRKIVNNIKAMEREHVDVEPIGGNDEIAALNEAIADTNRKIKEAEQFQSQTARIVAQELEQPLNQISDYLLDMKANGFEELNANGNERIERSMLEVARLRSLVKDLISLDKISRIGWELEYVTVNLADIARTAADTVQDYAKKSGVEIVLRIEEVSVVGDPARLQQIALNLLTNAIKFSPRKSKIEIEVFQENQFGKLSVIDQGTGIPEEFQQKIFGHFEQVSHSDGVEKGGSGLGLAISRRLVESQQGRMGFKSQLGAGSTFWFSLPISQESTESRARSIEKKQVGLQRLSVRPDKVVESSQNSHDSIESTHAHEKVYHSTLWRSSLIIVLLPLLVQLITIGALWNVIGSVRNNVNEIHRFSQITSLHAKLMDELIRTNLGAIFYNITPSTELQARNDQGRYLVRSLVDQLREVSSSDSVLAKDVESLDKMVQEQFQMQDEFMRAESDLLVERYFGPNSLSETERKMVQVVIPLEQATRQERKLVERNVWAKTEMRQMVGNIALASAVCVIIVSILYGIFTIRGLTARVRRIVDNTKRLEAREPLLTPSEEWDEIGFVEQSFYDAANKLTKLEQYKQELIALTSHEFRTPLTSLLAKADLMEAGVFGPLNEHGKTVVVKVKRSISDLISLLTNLLDVEKIQSGKSLVVKEEASMDAILQKVAGNVSDFAKEREIAISIDGGEMRVSVDAARLVQALTAVLINIAQFAPPGSSLAVSVGHARNELSLTVTAPGGECSREALNTSSARGRLASDILRLIVHQHGGRTIINHGENELSILVRLPIDGTSQAAA